MDGEQTDGDRSRNARIKADTMKNGERAE